MKSPASRLKPQNGAVHFAYYNFCRIHTTLRVTPAMASGITATAWDLADLLAAQKKRPTRL